jgi:beta-phosphoglucomutase
MNQIRALLCDLDGTLVDTGCANFLAYAQALEEIGVKISRDAFDRVASGRNWRDFLPAILAAHSTEADAASIAARKTEIYGNNMRHTVVNDALVSLLQTTRNVWKTGLVTTASAASVGSILSFHKLAGLFDVVVTGNDVTAHKPDPEAYRTAALRLGVTADECLIIEDSDVGVASAQAFGGNFLRISMVAAAPPAPTPTSSIGNGMSPSE